MFFVNWDKPSLDSLEQHIGDTTHMMPVWFHISADGAQAICDQQLLSHAHSHNHGFVILRAADTVNA